VWLPRPSTQSDHLLVSTTVQVPACSHMGNPPVCTHPSHLLPCRHTGHLPARTHMDQIRATLEAPLTRSDETAGKTSRLSQITRVFAKACFFTLVVAGLSDCSSMVYAPKAAVRTGTVRSSTIRQMEALDMDRAAPILIRIYKEDAGDLETGPERKICAAQLLSNLQIFRESWAETYAGRPSSTRGFL